MVLHPSLVLLYKMRNDSVNNFLIFTAKHSPNNVNEDDCFRNLSFLKKRPSWDTNAVDALDGVESANEVLNPHAWIQEPLSRVGS